MPGPRPGPEAGPPSLAELQAWMRWVITDPRGAERALAGAEPGPGFEVYPGRYQAPRPDCRQAVLCGRGLDVYAEAYFARLAESLGQDFPAVKRVLGDEAFAQL